jgi:membrane-associated phospholipid phosphatase
LSVCIAGTTITGIPAVHAQNGDDALLKYLRVGGPLDRPAGATSQFAAQPAAQPAPQPAYARPAPIRPQPVASFRPATAPALPGTHVPTAPLKVPDSFHRATRAINAQQASQRVPQTFVRPPPVTRRLPATGNPVSFQEVPLPGQQVPLPGAMPGSIPSPVYKQQTAQQTAAPADMAAEPKNVSILSTDYLLSYPQNLWRIVSAPINFDTNDWLIAGGVAATTGLLMLADKEINDTWRDDIQSGTLDDFLDAMETFGDSQTVIFTAAAGYVLGELVGRDRDQEAALLLAQSFVLSAGLTQGLKFAFRRDRPDDSRDDQYSFFSSDASKTNSSFPSGHATNAFSMAAVLTNVYEPDAPWLGWVLYPIATMTSLARVNNERHWASDVFLGGALGYFIGRMVVRYSPFRDNQSLSVLPMMDSGVNGLRLVHKI